MIIIDGPDKVGKTTLAKKFVEYGFYYFRISKDGIKGTKFYSRDPKLLNFATAYKIQITLLTSLIEDGFLNNMVIDRFMASEFAYTSDPNDATVQWLDKRLSTHCLHPPAYVYLAADPDWIWARLDPDEKLQMSQKVLDTICHRFEMYYNFTRLPKCKILVDQLTEDSTFNIAKAFLFDMEEIE